MLDRKPVSARYCSRMKLAHPTYIYVVDVEGAESLTI